MEVFSYIWNGLRDVRERFAARGSGVNPVPQLIDAGRHRHLERFAGRALGLVAFTPSRGEIVEDGVQFVLPRNFPGAP